MKIARRSRYIGPLLLVLSIVISAKAKDDLVLTGATIYDGSGSSPVVGFVAVDNGKITAVGDGQPPEATWTIDAQGLIVCPGFIDLHTHSDSGVVSSTRRACVNYLMQGCTTSVTGNCGGGKRLVGRFYDEIDEVGAGTNVAHLIPQGTLRRYVVGNEDREATKEELQQMRDMVQQAMKDGAWGMSTGLIYSPGIFTPTEELIDLAKLVSLQDGIYASHIRNEEAELLPAIEEAIRIGKESGCPVHISHIKSAGTSNWGSAHLAIRTIEEARTQNQRVTADQYPYTALSTSLTPILFPGWARSGGRSKLADRLDDPELAAKIRAEVTKKLADISDGERIFIVRCSSYPKYAGQNLKHIAEAEGSTSLAIAEKIVRGSGASIVSFAMSEDDVRQIMKRPWVATASDASTRLPSASRPHPRGFGTFPRKLGYYALREEVIPLEHAIRSATGLPADIIGFSDRGYLKPGMAADIVVFDPDKLIDKATFDEPNHYSEGIQYVFVNGKVAVSERVPTGALAGKALRKRQKEETQMTPTK
ncbi:N-acyl-D-amino-acid deacylase family protein [Bremerella alba]|uniref:D-aminoacylase n=1 Tax=Bremerella alba TaxID=980252 RepID=A0A7V8V252_9BACT|nr:D-aminoacylase [Bremerella alba]MBA2113548.1 D-aminoacylase [Bremerella alba]